ncbi:MAG: YqiA/YcfP family alpha/beta fold hydrolase [Porphyromonas sp.]|nr:YqiA/YcfP family alpha/beta fold hydrolase [Porphyromonas sp.]
MSSLTILYLHGLTSSYMSSRGKFLRELLPKNNILTPDIPLNAHVALKFLLDLVSREEPDIIVGSSMGGLFAHQLPASKKILINPAFTTSSVMARYKGLRLRFYHERFNPDEKDFEVTDELLRSYTEVESEQWNAIKSKDADATVGIFSLQDEVIREDALFDKYYKKKIYIEATHQLSYKEMEDFVIPEIENFRNSKLICPQ